jgi:fructose-bisphosphate aldolase class II
MIVSPASWFEQALAGGWALGAFNVANLEFVQAVIGAAEKMQAPVIVQTSEGAIEYAGEKVLAALTREVAARVTVPIILHLDHGKSLKMVKRCVAAGYTSVMIDASQQDLAENIKVTREVVDYAKGEGVWVEAELGAIIGQEGMVELAGGKTPTALLTKPEEAEEFVSKTGVDALAVSVGTIHGVFEGQEYIRFELLEELQRRLGDFPLVVHGSSGLPAEDLRQVAATSVCKFNVDTELRLSFEAALRDYLAQPQTKVDPRQLLGAGREAVQNIVEEKLTIFGATGKAVTLMSDV